MNFQNRINGPRYETIQNLRTFLRSGEPAIAAPDWEEVVAWKSSLGVDYSRKSLWHQMNSLRCRFSEQCLDCRAQLGRVFTGSILNREWTGALFIAGARSTNKATFSFSFTTEVKRFPNSLSLCQYRKLLRGSGARPNLRSFCFNYSTVSCLKLKIQFLQTIFEPWTISSSTIVYVPSIRPNYVYLIKSLARN